MLYAAPGTPGAKVQFKAVYDNFINGKFVPPLRGQTFDVITPINGKIFTKAARSTAEDIELALDAAHAAKAKWGATPAADRANVLLKIADRLEQNLELLAYAESVDNGKPMRETLNADIPLTIDHFRYFAGCLRAQEGALSDIDEQTIAYHFHEPLGVVGAGVARDGRALHAQDAGRGDGTVGGCGGGAPCAEPARGAGVCRAGRRHADRRGLLVMLRHRASFGGINILALYLNQRFGWSAGKVQLAVDLGVLATALGVIDPPRVAWSILAAVAVNAVLIWNHRPGRYLPA